jgi:hypothetical protein
MAALWPLLWALSAQTRGPVALPLLGQAYDPSAGAVLVFTGTPGTARVFLKPLPLDGGQCTYAAAPAIWFCTGADGQVSAIPADGSAPRAIEVPFAPDSLTVSRSGSAALLWYAGLRQAYLVTAAGSAIRMVEPSAPVTEVLAVRDDATMFLARGDDGCAWLLPIDDMPRCVQVGDGAVAGAFTDRGSLLLAYRANAEVYLARAGAYIAELLVGPGDGIVQPVAVVGTDRYVLVADRGAALIQAIDLETRAIRAMPSPAAPSQFLPLGGGLYLTTTFDSGNLIMVETGASPRVLATAVDTGGGQ